MSLFANAFLTVFCFFSKKSKNINKQLNTQNTQNYSPLYHITTKSKKPLKSISKQA
jgi:hypothetical protein